MQEVKNQDYKKFIDKIVEWEEGIHHDHGKVETVYFSIPLNRDIARILVGKDMRQLVDCDLLRFKK